MHFALVTPYGNATPFRQNDNDSVIHRVRSGNKFFWDEISERSRITVDENEIEWVRDNEISVTIPMISQGELVGVLNLGKKQNEEDYLFGRPGYFNTGISSDSPGAAKPESAIGLHR